MNATQKAYEIIEIERILSRDRVSETQREYLERKLEDLNGINYADD